MSATDDVARMLTLVPWLLERPGASVAETAAAFGVDAPTIRRDLAQLDFCGLPGLGGGALFEVSLVGDRILVELADELRRPLRPTPAELLELLLRADAAARLLGERYPALDTALTRIRSALGVPRSAGAVVTSEADELVATILSAVSAGRRVSFRYRSRGEDLARLREVDPWVVHLEDGRWYLIGHDHAVGAARIFRLDRATDAELDQRAAVVDPPDPLPVPAYTPEPGDLQVVLEVSPGGRWIADALTLDEQRVADDGSAWLRLRTDRPRYIVRLVLMAGGDARVVEPGWLAAEVRDRAAEALARYADDGS